MEDKNYLINEELKNQSKLIIKSFALGALKPKFFTNPGDLNQRTLEEATRAEGTDGNYSGEFGLPVFDILTFIGFSYKTLDGKTITVPTINFGVALVDVTQSKNIVRTPIQGRNGDIMEYVSDSNFSLNIRGVLTSNAQDTYPTELVKQLLEFLKAPVSFGVASKILDKFGVQEIVVTDYYFPQNEGMRNVVAFNIGAVSETPFEIKSLIQN